MDDGGDLVNKLHTTRRELIPELWGGSEETTTGVIRLRALAETGKLAFPMIAVREACVPHDCCQRQQLQIFI